MAIRNQHLKNLLWCLKKEKEWGFNKRSEIIYYYSWRYIFQLGRADKGFVYINLVEVNGMEWK